MPSFGTTSAARLSTCDRQLQELFERVVQTFDCSIICGTRDKAEQDRVFAEGLSKAKWLESPHNYSPSFAVDALPYPIDWGDRERMTYFAGYVKATAVNMAIPLIWGGDWDDDTEVRDNKFDDLVHFELANRRTLAADRPQSE